MKLQRYDKNGFPDNDGFWVMADEVAQLEAELIECKRYADRLAEGLPEGMLPKDIELLRVSNIQLIAERDALLLKYAKYKAALEYSLKVFTNMMKDDIADYVESLIEGGE